MLQQAIKAVELLDSEVHLNATYLGQDRKGQLFSIRGDAELTGDKLGLCAQALAEDPRHALRFLDCQAQRFDKIPEDWDSCAEKAKISVNAMRDCAEGSQGEKLARESFLENVRSNITSSPTLTIAGKSYDGPRHSLAIARAICGAARDQPPPKCAELGGYTPVSVRLIGDARCTEPRCSVDGLRKAIGQAVPGARFEAIDYSDPAAKTLRDAIKYLPVAIIDPALSKDREAKKNLEDQLTRIASGQYVLASAATWDPRAELCGNGEDDDGDGKSDCEDPE